MNLSEEKDRYEARESLWRATCVIGRREHLAADHTEAEAVVIGAGLAGILTAYMLRERGIDVLVVEAFGIGSGVTQNTTAKITSQHNLLYHKLISDFGKEKAEQYARANEWAIANYGRLTKEKNIECDYLEKSAFLYTLEDEHVDIIRAEAEAAASLGIPAAFLGEDELVKGHDGWGLPFSARSAVRFDRQAQFHPLKFLKAVAADLPVFENTRVLDVELNIGAGFGTHEEGKSTVITDRGKITAKHVVFACHYPFINIPGYYFARMHQERSYLIAFSGAADVGGMYKGVDKSGYSFRNQGELLILGGSEHRTGENQDGGCYDAIRKAARKWYPQSKECYAWSAQDCITLDAVPYIGRYAETRPNWYVATGFRKWGMTASMAAAGIISDMIAGQPAPGGVGEFLGFPEREDNVFSPHRFSVPVSAEKLWKDVKTISKALLKEVFDMPEEKLNEVQRGHGGIVEHQGQKIGVYRDRNDQTYMVDTRCRHMGCQLAWNPEELTWDCPCHGSRFDYKGNLVSGPATMDLEKP